MHMSLKTVGLSRSPKVCLCAALSSGIFQHFHLSGFPALPFHSGKPPGSTCCSLPATLSSRGSYRLTSLVSYLKNQSLSMFNIQCLENCCLIQCVLFLVGFYFQVSFYRSMAVERGESCSVDSVSLLCMLGIEWPRCWERAPGVFL